MTFKKIDSVREVLTFTIFDMQKPFGFCTFEGSDVQNLIGFWTSETYEAKKTLQEMNIGRQESEDLPHGIGGEARAMSPSSVGQGCWGPLNEDKEFR